MQFWVGENRLGVDRFTIAYFRGSSGSCATARGNSQEHQGGDELRGKVIFREILLVLFYKAESEYNVQDLCQPFSRPIADVVALIEFELKAILWG